jgi:hypothetical protein
MFQYLSCWRFYTILFCEILCSCIALAQNQTPRQIAQTAFPSVVLLVLEDSNGQPASLGSGFFVGDNIVATNVHVIEGSARGYAKIVGQKTRYDIDGIIGIDNAHDLALLSIKGVKAPKLTIGDSKQMAVGDEVYAVGNPLGLEGTFSQGVIGGIRQIGDDSLLQITAPISPGSSGGPVFNATGQVIGIAVATFKGGQNLNLAIPSTYLTALLGNLTPIVPLSDKSTIKKEKSIINDMGGKSVEGVVCENFLWTYNTELGKFSFSIRNKLRDNITRVHGLIIFYDKNDQPLETHEFLTGELFFTIKSGLAKRIEGRSVDGSVQKLTTKYGEGQPYTKIEYRILDFKLCDE